MESLREENQRLDKLVQQQKAGASPVEKARTPRAEGSQESNPGRSTEGDCPAQRVDPAAAARGTDGSRGARGSTPTRG